jgi:hypothetical protein
MERKRRKQEERVRKLEEKKKLFSSMSSFSSTSSSSCDTNKKNSDSDNKHSEDIQSENADEIDVCDAVENNSKQNQLVETPRRRNPFSIDSLLEKSSDNNDVVKGVNEDLPNIFSGDIKTSRVSSGNTEMML